MVDYIAIDIDSVHSKFITFDVKPTEVVYLFCPGVVDGGLDIIEWPTTTAGGNVSYETATPATACAVKRGGCDRAKSLILMRMAGYNKIDTGIGKDAEDLGRAPV
jgi:hypothetical protein